MLREMEWYGDEELRRELDAPGDSNTRHLEEEIEETLVPLRNVLNRTGGGTKVEVGRQGGKLRVRLKGRAGSDFEEPGVLADRLRRGQ